MLNQSADYALRAVLFVAQHSDNGSCSADTIAAATGVPRNYLGKVLHALTHAQVLSSVRGPNGGFRLAVAPEALTLAEVVGPFQKLPARQVCLRGNGECDAANPCDSHQRWQDMADQITGFFHGTTIALMLSDAPVHGGNGANGSAPHAIPTPVPGTAG
jgi:Rrf2 family transcriptional regulator, iron-sulfur cluster assembly transcription factor